MKKLLVTSALIALSVTLETKVEAGAEIQTGQLSALRTLFNDYVGRWTGGGVQTIFSLGSSIPDDRLVPNGFT